MSSHIKTNAPPPVRESEHAVAQKSRASALERADAELAQERRINYARIDVGASKWRYVSPSAQ
jgi:hypothetical protein